ncbi:MAG TPA: FHA domain-containing protein [Micromonosporaceae bacterium]|nr:FHA domain-containing protein [Micromonosporaceae bacterium]
MTSEEPPTAALQAAASQPPARAATAVEVRSGSTRALARRDRPVVVGRDPACHLVVDDPLVSRRHAEVGWVDGAWAVRDLDSRNGTYLAGRRVATAPVAPGAEIRLGDAARGPVLAVAPAETAHTLVDELAPAVAGRTQAAEYDASGRVRIGRDPANDIVLSDLRISRFHAEVRRDASGFQVTDLGSRNGTFVNGQPVSRATLTPGDMVSIGRHELVFDGKRLHEYEDTGPVSLTAERLTVVMGKQVLLDDVSFCLEEGSLLAVVGPSGCGKSTLVRAVTGLRPATRGRVRYDGRDLYADYAELRYRIGLVPQDDVLHRQLTVHRALRFAAALRFADDVPRRERVARVNEVMETLGLAERAKQRIDTLSGGQRKRTSVALELLTEPSMLFLDEPTSGLDPALDKEIMEELRELADRGRTVVVVTHNVLHLDLCDRVLVLGQGGKLGYFGPPDELLEFFGATDYAEVFAGVTRDPERWQQAFRRSDRYGRYVGTPPPVETAAAVAGRAAATAAGTARPAAQLDRAAQPDRARPGERTAELDRAGPQEPAAAPVAQAEPARPAVGRAAVRRAPLGRVPLRTRALHPAAPVRQFFTLCARMFSVIAADRGYVLFLLGLPLALALLTRTVPGDNGLAPPTTRFSLEAQRLLVVLVVGAAFLGIAAAIREIVNEASIYRRERAVGLSPGAYLGSKLAVFTLINTAQVVVFVYLSLLGRGTPAESLVIPSPTGEIMVAIALVAVTATVVGLCVSALVRTTEQTTPLLVVLVMAQLVLSGGLFELDGEAVLEQVSWLSPTRWGFAAGASTVDLLSMIPFKDSLWAHEAFAWWRSVVLLVVQAALLTVLARLALRRLEPGRG